jgi:hypothetical protein
MTCACPMSVEETGRLGLREVPALRERRSALQHLTKSSDLVEADGSAAEENKGLVDVGAPLVSRMEAREAGEPSQCAFHDPAVPAQLLARLDTTSGDSSVRAIQLERGRGPATLHGMTQRSPFRYFKTSPEVIRLAVMLYVRFPLSLRDVEDLLHERGIDVSHETVRF